MNKPIMICAIDDLRQARDRILKAHITLKNAGVNRWSVLSHLEGALTEVLDSMGDVQLKCDQGKCSVEE